MFVFFFVQYILFLEVQYKKQNRLNFENNSDTMNIVLRQNKDGRLNEAAYIIHEQNDSHSISVFTQHSSSRLSQTVPWDLELIDC